MSFTKGTLCHILERFLLIISRNNFRKRMEALPEKCSCPVISLPLSHQGQQNVNIQRENFDSMRSVFKTKFPWIQAPMYHYTGPELVIACSKAGILGSLSVQEPQRMKKSLESIKQSKIEQYACNLFVIPDHLSQNQPPIPHTVVEKLHEFRKELGLPLEPVMPTDSYKQELEEQLDLIVQFKVPFVILTFGLLDQAVCKGLQQKGIKLIGSATSVKEAVECQERGMDAVILQGVEAGGHRTSIHLPLYGSTGLLTLLSLAKKEIKIPIIAAGGISSGQQIKAAMNAGADGVSIGSLFLTASECNTPKSHRQLLRNTTAETETVLTRLFTGRPARMIPNRFYNEMKKTVDQIPGGEDSLPWNFYARDIFGKAAKLDNPELYINWGGQAVGMLSGRDTMSASEIISQLKREFD
jgi:nitronate monooxygenase